MDRELLHRSVRFVVTVMVPVGIAFAIGTRSWLVYAVLSAITGFLGDEGGRPLLRLGYMLTGPCALLGGVAVGGVGWPNSGFIALTVLLGLFYGLVEGGHPLLLLVARFAGYGLVLGFEVAALRATEILAAFAAALAAWLISLAWEAARRAPRQVGVEPALLSLGRALRLWRRRWSFALAGGLSIGAANLVGIWVGLGHAYWATLTILIVLRDDMTESAEAVTHRVSGTLLGVAAVAALITWLPGPQALFAAMVVIAALRWPALSLDLTLGTACITAFVLLVADLLAASPVAEMRVLQDRLLAIMVGCCFALAGLRLRRGIAGLAKAG